MFILSHETKIQSNLDLKRLPPQTIWFSTKSVEKMSWLSNKTLVLDPTTLSC